MLTGNFDSGLSFTSDITNRMHSTKAISGKRAGAKMNKSLKSYTSILVLFSLLAVAAYSRKAQAQAQPQYPILDMAASKVIQKYQNATCEQLWIKKSQKAPPSAEEQKVIGFLKNDPQMRTVFIDKVAAPIANKMFECGMIP